jgi:hypothetical protein
VTRVHADIEVEAATFLGFSVFCVRLSRVDEEQLLGRAAEAWSHGQQSDALRQLKDAIRLDPSLGSVRRVLADRYREMGKPDQAGRWGIALDGWTTDVERDRLARLLAASGIDESQAARFLVLPDSRVPESVKELLQGPTAVYRNRFRAQLREDYPEKDRSPLFVSTSILWVLFVITSVGGAYAISGFAVLGLATSLLARTIVLVGVGILAMALASSAALAATMTAKGWAAGWALGSLIVGVVTVWTSASGWALR